MVDFKRLYHGLPAKVCSIEYDPYRSSFIALILYSSGFYSYIVAPFQLSVGTTIISSASRSMSSIDIGYTGKLTNIPVGTIIHNLETTPSDGGKLLRSAGSFGLLLRKEDMYVAVIRLRSGEKRYFNLNVAATIGSISNFEHRYTNLGKAGRSRWLGRKPSVRGVAMNPIDHPHGGDTSGGKVHSTPWSVPTKGKPTRRTQRNFLAAF
jgi:large subunit ribosomal protein L2